MDWLVGDEHRTRAIDVDPNSVVLLEGPVEFYQTLLKSTEAAEKRICLSTLYLGTGPLEQKLVSVLNDALTSKSGLETLILMDYLRGTRENGSTGMLKETAGLSNAKICLYHTPEFRGILKKILGERTNEIIGLQHMKIYVFDDDVLISGANLSETYFTDRQDRYVLIKNNPTLAGFFQELISAVASCSFRLHDGGILKLHEDCSVHPYEGVANEYRSLVNQRVLRVLSKYAKESGDSSEACTKVYPLVQMGLFGINQEYDLMRTLFARKDPYMNLSVASGYFNLTNEYSDVIAKEGDYSLSVVLASPQANGFYNGAALSGYIPLVYVYVSKLFYELVRNRPVKLFEYQRDGWSFHAKGIWLNFPKNQSEYAATIFGSSNYGYRSVHRDLEAQVLLVTRDKNLKRRLSEEEGRLFEWSSMVETTTFRRTDHQIPYWVRIFSRCFRNFF
ncbi:hypothetical protein QR680_005542 [Steinernema hermaphroditum]|uniref:CDP-diacylglycerol--glycerol-3-phosphate 3-phosphatidyltransferase n=1 Tax=Steinernema hermaphroditum TaxID=289476 RepID=A0AA39LV23_9BILA|nr:hypothetical protein QR680_005542 [Steinernema hermaphroditum]